MIGKRGNDRNFAGGHQRRKKKHQQEWNPAADKSESGKHMDEELISSSDDDDENGGGKGGESQNEQSYQQRLEAKETALEKRNRLANELLTKLASKKSSNEPQEEATDGEEVDQVDRALRKEVLRADGRLVRNVASKLQERLQTGAVVRSSYRSSHSQSVTCVCIAQDESTCFSGSKDGSIVAWDIEKNLAKWKADVKEQSRVLGIACSSDGKYLASCGDKKSSTINIWDLRESSLKRPIKTLSGHRDIVTSLVFREGTSTLLSASDDRSVRIWNVDEGSFIENLFGHPSRICAIDCLSRERCVTSAEDLTVRLWKIPEETHLLLSGRHSGPIDCVKMLNESTFISGAQDGNLALWNVTKRRPTHVITNAHGPDHWIESVAGMHHSDIVASGSEDGLIRLWQVNIGKFRINPDPVAALPCVGHVNALAFGPKSGSLIVAGVGREPRLGRWRVNNEAKNGVVMFRLPPMEQLSDDDE